MMKAETEKQNLVKLKGQLERVTFENEENAYTVAKIKVYGYSDLVTIVGNIPSPTPGEILSLSGECSSHIILGSSSRVFFAPARFLHLLTSVTLDSLSLAEVVSTLKYSARIRFRRKRSQKRQSGSDSHGVSSAYATKIYKRYGNESIAVVKKNPYRLAHDIVGIGFLTADKIARKLGFDEKSPLRAAAGIMPT